MSISVVVSVEVGNSEQGAVLIGGQDYTLRVGDAAYATATGPQLIALADVPVVTAGSRVGAKWQKAGSTNPDWAGMSFALKPV